MKYRFLTIFLVLGLVACGEQTPKPLSVSYDKVEDATKVFPPTVKLPTQILDLKFVEYKIGSSERVPGPSDYYSYIRIQVKPEYVKNWVKNLKEPYNNTTTYSAPNIKQNWWLSQGDFERCELYETYTLFNRYNGWLCVDEKSGYIYAYTFTM